MRHRRSRYPSLSASDPRWTAAVFGGWTLAAVLGALAALGAVVAARWVWRVVRG